MDSHFNYLINRNKYLFYYYFLFPFFIKINKLNEINVKYFFPATENSYMYTVIFKNFAI
jgi:hypothetical protein